MVSSIANSLFLPLAHVDDTPAQPCPRNDAVARRRRDERIARMLAAGFTVAEVARAVGISRRHLYRRLHRPGFQPIPDPS